MNNETKEAAAILKKYMDFLLNDEEFFCQFGEIVEKIENNKTDIPVWLVNIINDFKLVNDEKFLNNEQCYISTTEFRYNISRALD